MTWSLVDHVKTARSRRLWLETFCVVALLYLLSAHWSSVPSFDSVAAAWPAWAAVHHGTLHLDHVAGLPLDPWFIPHNGHTVSSRTPGVVLGGIPFQALFAWTGWSPWPASVVAAALFSAGCAANMLLLLRRTVSAKATVLGTVVLAFGTSLWTVASGELWTHGPDAFWLSAGLLALARRRTGWAAVLLFPAVLTRPHLAVAIVILGSTVAWGKRQLAPAALLAASAAAGLFAVVIYNHLLFGGWSVSGGTYSYATAHVLHGSAGADNQLQSLASNIAGLLGSPMRGLLAFTPVAAVIVLGLPHGWRSLPSWGRGAALGAIGYLLVQARVNGFEGGFDFYGSRLTIEAAVLCTPLAVHSAVRLSRLRWGKASLLAGSAVSIVISILGVTVGQTLVVPHSRSPWSTWLPAYALRTRPTESIVVLGLLAAAVLLWLAIRARQNPGPAPAGHGMLSPRAADPGRPDRTNALATGLPSGS